jgi:phosphohistidine phosphatase SixA
VLVVSHQPFLSQAVSQILDFPLTLTLPFRKGSLWWLRIRSEHGVMKPQLLTIQETDFL